ncbi:MAG: peptidylprolyl isomerase [Caldilineae bacterium]|nr:peptidylprolyl isomerase [Anaerolineae bacterium]MCB0200779.1 peptidylprolyl isomerase [Anaerolineae bacterium]MCB0204996.1 peptidylprolyl isomerase [Anaerolineae bacterium]MCB0255529.1 peptidylprolyl isomerase [Anaerolineae bacterium]MCB9154627.1 peptidylprolyl isomerase [Caldilineae bacterium]
MAKRRRRERVEPSRKEQTMTRVERERARRLTIIVGVVLGIAVVVLVAGVLFQLVVKPNSTVARVNDTRISAKDLDKESRFVQLQTIAQLEQLIQLQQSFGSSDTGGFFSSQISQLQNDLVSNEGLANRVMESMIDTKLVQQLAAERGITASDDEVQKRLESFIATQQGFVTAPDATATAEALAAATPTPTLTPSPTPTTTLTSTVTVTPTEVLPTPTVHVQTADDFSSGLDQVLTSIASGSGLSADEVRNIYVTSITDQILREQLTEQLGDEMPLAGEQVHARHILISVPQDASPEDEQQALSKAISITQQLNDGADFATLAAEFSDDTSNAASGGDLGFFGKGQMVAEFEDAAFSLGVNEISEPVRTQFGYHIIQVLETSPGSPDFTSWLENQKAAARIVRSLTSDLVPNLPAVPSNLLTAQ